MCVSEGRREHIFKRHKYCGNTDCVQNTIISTEDNIEIWNMPNVSTIISTVGTKTIWWNRTFNVGGVEATVIFHPLSHFANIAFSNVSFTGQDKHNNRYIGNESWQFMASGKSSCQRPETQGIWMGDQMN